MKRRKFLRNTTLSMATLPSFPGGQFTRILPPGLFGHPAAADFPLSGLSIDDLQEKMRSGALSAYSIAELYLDRIREIDRSGPKINAVIELNPDALDIARTLDEERRAGKLRGPMHGIPVLIKDNIDTGDKMMTTAGALALEGNRAAQDAFIIRQLRAAGAVILGKTNLSEWANFRSTRSTSGWSSRGGQTKNPHVLDRTPCGSSSGSGAAVAAELCAVAIGTETNGSIACPASMNGIVGVKPTVGLLSRSGIIPISHTQDTAGPMTRTVRDAAILLGALTGIDPTDALTSNSLGKAQTDYTVFLNGEALAGKRIGIEKSFLKVHPAVDLLFQEAIDVLKGRGATVVEVDLWDRIKGLSNERLQVLLYEFKDGVNRYLAGANAPVKSLEDVIAFNQGNASRTMPYFQQELLESAHEKGDLETPEYREALEKVLRVTRDAIDTVLQENQLDALAGPANGPAGCIDLVNGGYSTGYGMYSPAAVAGYPSVVVPMGAVFHLPIGLCFFGPAYSEPDLLAIAYAYEQASHKRVTPGFRTGIE